MIDPTTGQTSIDYQSALARQLMQSAQQGRSRTALEGIGTILAPQLAGALMAKNAASQQDALKAEQSQALGSLLAASGIELPEGMDVGQLPSGVQGTLLAKALDPTVAKREREKDAAGFWRYTDDGSRVFPEAEVAPKRTSTQKEYDLAVEGGFQGSFFDYQKALKSAGKSTTTVNNNMGSSDFRPEIGKIPPGYQAVYNPDAKSYEFQSIPGGPVEEEQAEAAKAEAAGQAQKSTSANIVIEDIDRALSLADESTLPTTGAFGGALSNVPGTAAYDTGKLLDSVKSNAAFDRLQAMRDASKTGGALGAVSQNELNLLQSSIGSLEQSQSDEQFKRNLKRVRDVYSEIIHGPKETSKSSRAPKRRASDFSALTPDMIDSMSEEEAAEILRNMQQ